MHTNAVYAGTHQCNYGYVTMSSYYIVMSLWKNYNAYNMRFDTYFTILLRLSYDVIVIAMQQTFIAISITCV